jgi:hypothetical protein
MRHVLCLCALLAGIAGCGGSTTTTRTTTSVTFEGGDFVERLEAACAATRTGFAQASNDRQATKVVETLVRRLDALEPDPELADAFEQFRALWRDELEAFRAGRQPPQRDAAALAKFRRPLQRAGARSC